MPLLKNNANIHGLTIDTIEFSDIDQSEGNWIIDTGYIQTITFSNATFSKIKNLDEVDETSGILFISTLDLDSQFDIGISNILFNGSTTNFISFGSMINTPPTAKHLEIINSTYTDSYIRTDRKLLSTEGIEVDENFMIYLSLITFTQITFYSTGSLISFGHKLPDYVQVAGLTISDIIAGRIQIGSTNQQNTDVLTQVSISDSTFDDIDDQFSSLIITEQGGRLNVTNSSFTNIF